MKVEVRSPLPTQPNFLDFGKNILILYLSVKLMPYIKYIVIRRSVSPLRAYVYN